MRSLNLDQLQTLVTIADLGTFAAAAQALHLAPPTVSLHVSELEARLAAQLLERGARRARPTAAGAALIERARRLLREADDASEQVRRIAAGRAGKVRLGTSTGVIVYLLPRVLERLAAASPEIDVEVTIMSSADTLRRLDAGTVDIGIVALPQAARPDIVLQPWRSDPMMAFMPQAWVAPRAVTPEWLAARPLIANDATTTMYRLVAEWFGRAGLQPRARIELNYTEAMKSLVAAGYGAAVLPVENRAEADPLGRLQIRALKPALRRPLGIAHRAPAQLAAAAHEVLRVLRGLRPE